MSIATLPDRKFVLVLPASRFERVLNAPTRPERADLTILGGENCGEILDALPAKNPLRQLSDWKQRIRDFGEGGIRTHHDPLDSVSYRFRIARVAVNASDAVAPCTRLHPRPTSPAFSLAAVGSVQAWIIPLSLRGCSGRYARRAARS